MVAGICQSSSPVRVPDRHHRQAALREPDRPGFGITRDMLDAGLNMQDFIVPEEWEVVQRNLETVLTGTRPVTILTTSGAKTGP